MPSRRSQRWRERNSSGSLGFELLADGPLGIVLNPAVSAGLKGSTMGTQEAGPHRDLSERSGWPTGLTR